MKTVSGYIIAFFVLGGSITIFNSSAPNDIKIGKEVVMDYSDNFVKYNFYMDSITKTQIQTDEIIFEVKDKLKNIQK